MSNKLEHTEIELVAEEMECIVIGHLTETKLFADETGCAVTGIVTDETRGPGTELADEIN